MDGAVELAGRERLELKVAGPSMLGIGRPGSHVLMLTPPKNARTAMRVSPARAGSFMGGGADLAEPKGERQSCTESCRRLSWVDRVKPTQSGNRVSPSWRQSEDHITKVARQCVRRCRTGSAGINPNDLAALLTRLQSRGGARGVCTDAVDGWLAVALPRT
jgi:hypothetical protein